MTISIHPYGCSSTAAGLTKPATYAGHVSTRKPRLCCAALVCSVPSGTATLAKLKASAERTPPSVTRQSAKHGTPAHVSKHSLGWS